MLSETPILSLLLFFLTFGLSAVEAAINVPITLLPYGSFRGKISGNVVEYLGMPFAAPPTGQLRFALPEPPQPFLGVRNASAFGAACPQLESSISPDSPITIPRPTNTSEDCLFINVFRPANIPLGKRLPVLFYMYGGGFVAGDSFQYPGDALVGRSIDLGEPVIYVTANYRMNAFGFLGGKEIQNAGLGNAGLYDQRAALKWVQDYIKAFGGDSDKVTIWGESAGALAVGLHMVINDGNTQGLFHRVIMESGSPIVIANITNQQPTFDALANATNCLASNEVLSCLRALPYQQLHDAMNNLGLGYSPSVDGKLILRDPTTSLDQGKYAKVQVINGDVDDEGTIIAAPLIPLNVSTTEQLLGLLKLAFVKSASTEDLLQVAQLYPDDITQGSPFDTGTANAATPQYKRIAAIITDLVFQGPRRNFLKIVYRTQPTYSFKYVWGKSKPLYGAFHGSDLGTFIGINNATDFIGIDAAIYFAYNGNPNVPQSSISLLRNITWPKWTPGGQLLTFVDPAPTITITPDTFRLNGTDFLTKLMLQEIGNGLG